MTLTRFAMMLPMLFRTWHSYSPSSVTFFLRRNTTRLNDSDPLTTWIRRWFPSNSGDPSLNHVNLAVALDSAVQFRTRGFPFWATTCWVSGRVNFIPVRNRSSPEKCKKFGYNKVMLQCLKILVFQKQGSLRNCTNIFCSFVPKTFLMWCSFPQNKCL